MSDLFPKQCYGSRHVTGAKPSSFHLSSEGPRGPGASALGLHSCMPPLQARPGVAEPMEMRQARWPGDQSRPRSP